MDFTPNRGSQPQPANSNAPSVKNRRSERDSGKGTRILIAVIGAAVTILILAVLAVITFGGPKNESRYVDTSRLQAVFLNTGQVYFGNIKSLNNHYFVVSNIYYLQTTNSSGSSGSASSSSTNNNITLVKLGCELHEPYDQMVINSDQVTFWENLQDNGQVAKAVKTFQQQNPNGQKCADQSSSSSTNSSSTTQNAAPSTSGSSTGTNSTTNSTTR